MKTIFYLKYTFTFRPIEMNTLYTYSKNKHFVQNLSIKDFSIQREGCEWKKGEEQTS